MAKLILMLFVFLLNGIFFMNPRPGSALDKISVFVSILPQQYFVEKIAGDLAEVSVMVLPGANPAVYEPKPKQMTSLAKSKIYFAIGVPFENVWLKKIAATNSNIQIIHTDAGIKKIPMASPHHHSYEVLEEKSHIHSDEGNHHENYPEKHTGIEDPHVWTSPPLVKIIAKNIKNAFLEIDPDNKSVYEANYKQFISELNELDAHIQRLFSKTNKNERAFMVFHPSWGYFADTYGLVQIPVELEGKEPKPAQLQKLIEHARLNDIKVIFVQPQFSTQNATVVAKAIGGRVVFADPLALDWVENLRKQAEAFNSVLK